MSCCSHHTSDPHHHHEHGPTNASQDTANPILVASYRGDLCENVHRGAFLIVDTKGNIHQQAGDIDRLIYPRSAIKPIQAIPFIETGTYEEFGCSPIELTLACASHNGEKAHVTSVRAWAERLGLTSENFICAPQRPSFQEAADILLTEQKPITKFHNNCSGKHTAFLATAKKLNLPLKNYHKFHHAIQQKWIGTLEMLSQTMLMDAPRGIDGCGIPQIALPLSNLALAMAHFGSPQDLPTPRAEACQKIYTAITENSYYLGGSQRFCTIATEALKGKGFVKLGADGIYVATFPEHQIGIAVKIDDGHAGAATITMANILRKCGLLSQEATEKLSPFFDQTLTNWAGEKVGTLSPTEWARNE